MVEKGSVIDMARDLMTYHGVGYLEFGFHHYINRPGVIGRCHVISNGPRLIPFRISLDEHWIAVLPEFKIREIVLHEIAHAKAPMYRYLDKHGGPWKEQCFKLGIDPNPKMEWSGPVPSTVNNFVPVP